MADLAKLLGRDLTSHSPIAHLHEQASRRSRKMSPYSMQPSMERKQHRCGTLTLHLCLALQAPC